MAEIVYDVVSTYSLYDLQEMRRFIDGEMEYIPEIYRKNLAPKMIEQIYSTHNILLCMNRDGYYTIPGLTAGYGALAIIAR
ncbi:MAG: DUF2115 domain-containing protein [Bacillus subtilis]|nr:DUF2115 domain-containing protein [Bacillus subtilis]